MQEAGKVGPMLTGTSRPARAKKEFQGGTAFARLVSNYFYYCPEY